MPLYNAGKDILQAFLAGHEEGRSTKALTLKNEQETADREQRGKQAQDALKQADQHFNATMAIQKALKDLQVQEHRMNISKSLSEGMPSGVPTDMAPTTTPQQDMASLNAGTFSHFDPLTMQKIAGTVAGAQGPSMEGTAHFGGDVGDVSYTDPVSFAAQQADRQRTLLAPKQEGSERLAGIKAQQATMLEQMKLDAANVLQAAKFKDELRKEADNYEKQTNLVRLRASLRPAKSGGIKPVPYAEIEKINAQRAPEDALPLGITNDEIRALNITPLKMLSPADNAKYNGLAALRLKLQNVLDLGESAKWEPHTAYAGGMLGKLNTKLGLDTKEQADYKAALGATSAGMIKKTYGTVVSKGEQELKDSWIPSLSENAASAKSKLNAAINDLTLEMSNIVPNSKAGAMSRPTSVPKPADGITLHYSDGSTEVVPNTPENRLKYGQHRRN